MSVGWIGVDLDGTLAEYEPGWGIKTIGPPIPAMVERIKGWLAEGREVRIVTARVAHYMTLDDRSPEKRDMANFYRHQQQVRMIEDYCKEHIGQALDVTCYKDFAMIQLWDDRAVYVVPNTGRPCCEAHTRR